MKTWEELIEEDPDVYEGFQVCPFCDSDQIEFKEDDENYHCYTCMRVFPFDPDLIPMKV